MAFHLFNNGLMVTTGLSGSDRRALEWTKIFLAKGIPVKVYTSEFGGDRYQRFGEKISLTVIRNCSLLAKNTFLTYFFRALCASFSIKRATIGDIFYSTSDLLPDAIPAFWGKLTHQQTKWLTGCHLLATNPFKNYQGKINFPSAKGLYYFFSQRLILFLAKYFADLVLVSNPLDRDFLIKKGFQAKKVMVTFGAVDKNAVNNAVAKKEKFEASFIGRYHPQKGLDDLLEIWRIVCQTYPHARMAMMGELNELLPKIKEIKLERNIKFLSFIDGIEKFSYLKSSRIFLFPSYYESFGMVAAEAMAAGLPVVAYNLAIYKEIYPQGMVKIPIGDYQQFAQVVVSLLKDEQKRNKIAKEAKNNALRFSWEDTASQILKKLDINA